MMKQTSQLEIPFPDDQSSAAVDPSTVPGASRVRFLSFDDAELRALQAVHRAVRKVSPSLLLAAQAALVTATGFALMFLSAIIGG